MDLHDIIAPGLKVLFVGINPGITTARLGYHFGHPGNRFWPALFAGGFTDRRLFPHEERELLTGGFGLTNLVARPTRGAGELTQKEIREGAGILRTKLETYRPRIAAVLSVGAYRIAFQRPGAQVGPQPETLGETRLWVLPDPSGLNAHFPPKKLAAAFADLRRAAG